MTLPLAERTEVLRWLRRTAAAHRKRFALLVLLFALSTAVGLIGPQLLGRLVDAVVAGAPVRQVDLLAAGFLAVLVVHALLARAARLRAAVFGEAVLAEARERVVGRALRLPLSTVEEAGTGDLLSRATSDVDRLDSTVRDAAPELTGAALALVFTAAAMVATAPLLACGLLVAVPLLVAVSRWYFPRARRTLTRLLADWAGVQSGIHETVRGARTIDSLRLAARRREHNDRVLAQAVADEQRHRGLLSIFLPALELSYVLPLAAILLIGGWSYHAGLAELGTVTTVVLYAAALSEPLAELFSWLEELQLGHAALRRILGVPGSGAGKPERAEHERRPEHERSAPHRPEPHRAAPERPELDHAAPDHPERERAEPERAESDRAAIRDAALGDTAPRDAGPERTEHRPAAGRGTSERAGSGAHDLVLRDVRFSYRAGREVLHGVDLRVPAGERLVVVGPSGAGKSTLGRLIAGVSAPDSGSVAFGDVEITALPPARVRREVLLLTQEQHVFTASLRDNLSLPEAREWTDRELHEALAVVGAAEWAARLPGGLDAVVGSGGAAVPAAVAQQLALARVVLADPHTLVLDEATSLLDGDGSRELERSLSRLLAGRTVIAIAHRLHTARTADRVAVVDGGRIVELGAHRELLAADGSYAALHRAAAGED
ncbi:ABC transporter ATP-binding protein/permease [Saccharopolyspora sp. 6T]|uniref:ABC transporter ATP-binding protein n=1 Tax=Saccharopolyspora sp. 6T TaxID=2877238 RepID=UPI001CD42902|nr:ABC transporter ATP-binding protein [Saccharopolyspora sp. 6T]MCA1189355.1 ABC transporter ATP-binding protein/permease [Saccharopolyspora sp. 6T]